MLLVYLLSTCVYLGENREVTCVQYCSCTGKFWTNGLSGKGFFFAFSWLLKPPFASLTVFAKITQSTYKHGMFIPFLLFIAESGLHDISTSAQIYTIFTRLISTLLIHVMASKLGSSMVQDLLLPSGQGAVVFTLISGRWQNEPRLCLLWENRSFSQLPKSTSPQQSRHLSARQALRVLFRKKTSLDVAIFWFVGGQCRSGQELSIRSPWSGESGFF